MTTATTTMTTCANCTRPFSAARDQCPHCGFPVQTAAPVAPTNTSLTACAACGHQVSVQAVACPSCGQPLHVKVLSRRQYVLRCMWWGLAVGIIMAALMAR